MSALADWLTRQPGPEACAPAPRRALAAIRRCRTPELGGHVYRCTDCAGTDFAYHSCHHRACPRCGGNRTAAWTAKQEARLLPVPYFLVTFTVPQELRPTFAAQPAAMHGALFRESAATLQQVAAERRLLGAELGFVGVLHTWGRQLQHHPHVHYIVPGGREEVHLASRSRKGCWRMSTNSIVQAALTNGWLDEQGVPNLQNLWIAYHYPKTDDADGGSIGEP